MSEQVVPEQAVVALDVGGTTIDAACVSAGGMVIGDLRESASPSAGTKDEIVAALARAIDGARDQVSPDPRAASGGSRVTACGIAIPAPFDYTAGVSHMTHKFQAIRGLKLGVLLTEATGLPVSFVNDADAFGLGVSWRQFPDAARLAVVTIGTGLGGGFIEDGRSLAEDPRVPPGGEVWDLPFEDGILEDYVSARGVVSLYEKALPRKTLREKAAGNTRGSHHQPSARGVSELARRGSQPALRAYQAMGTALGRGLAPVLARFAPEKIVVGGQVAQSLGLFGPAVSGALTAAGLPAIPVLPAAPGNLAILGAARVALSRG
jgi:glucokinase